MGAVRVSEVVVRVRVEGRQFARLCNGHGREEAVVEEAALDDEVYQSVKGVPDEQEAEAGPRRRCEDLARKAEGGEKNDEDRAQRDEGRLVEQVRWERGRHHDLEWDIPRRTMEMASNWMPPRLSTISRWLNEGSIETTDRAGFCGVGRRASTVRHSQVPC